jgi:carbonic anhydrase/acetyltransferase-like protein (isoleucine patch superfamily)
MSEGALLLSHGGHSPRVAATAFVAPGAVLVGDVELADQASVWYGCVLRGDVTSIRLGARSNLQDATIVHGSPGEPPTEIGDDVLVGHGAIVHGCVLETGCSVGMGATILNGAVVESGAQVAAGSLVPPGARIPGGELWGGVPARRLRPLTADEVDGLRAQARRYVTIASQHAESVALAQEVKR